MDAGRAGDPRSGIAVIAAALAAALLSLLALQSVLTLAFAGVITRRLASRPSLAKPAPAAEVVLCLRGADPSLAAALAALADQTYPGPWRLLVVVDSRHDPAWPVVERQIALLAASGRARWQAARLLPLESLPVGGSLKSASLRQAFGRLDAATQIVALLDADAVVAPGWLEALAAGCGQSGVGAVSGNRWYVPAESTGPGLVRGIWNGGALLMMTLLEVPWGGSLALRRDLIESSGWRETLATCFGEDTSLPEHLTRSGWRYQFRPELIVLDRDDGIAFRPLRRWITRQLLSARLHHAAWPLIALHGLGSWLLLLLVALSALVALALGHLQEGWLLLAALLLYELGCLFLLLVIEALAARASRPLGGQQLQRPGFVRCLQLLRWLPLAQWVCGLATLQAALAQRVEWRGVTYQVRGRGVQRLKVAEPAEAE